MFHPSELKAMKAAKNNRIKFTYNTKAKIVLLVDPYLSPILLDYLIELKLYVCDNLYNGESLSIEIDLLYY